MKKCCGVFVMVLVWLCFFGGVGVVVFLLWRCTEVLWGSVVEKCCEEVLWRSFVVKSCKEVLSRNVVKECREGAL